MNFTQKLTQRESVAVDCIKAFACLSVLAAHLVGLSEEGFYNNIVCSLWTIFGNVGVIAFFVIGGFLYSRNDGDSKAFWKKKLFRIIIPWVICSTITYIVGLIGGNTLSVYGFIRWVSGSNTWYYYVTVYLLFLLIFKWFYKYDLILYGIILIHITALTLNTFGISTTLPFEFFSDYLNLLYWMGYFSAGILIRRNFNRIKELNTKAVFCVALMVSVIANIILHIFKIYEYFNIFTFINCVSSTIVIAGISYCLANTKVAPHIKKIGVSSYCIYLLHMQIVQNAVRIMPQGAVLNTISPFIGLAIMMTLIFIGNFICSKLPFGDKLKMCVGL